MGTWEHIKLAEILRHNNTLGFFLCWGRSLKIDIEIKRGVVYKLLVLYQIPNRNKLFGICGCIGMRIQKPFAHLSYYFPFNLVTW
jgi:hypothetical protein